MTTKDAGGDIPAIVTPSGAKFKIRDTKFYFPVVTLSKETDTKLLEQLKTEFKKTIESYKYISQIPIQLQNKSLNYFNDWTFTNGNRFLVLSFQRIASENNATKYYRDSFSRYYLPNVRIKDFNVLIDGKNFFDLPVKIEGKAYEKIIEMSNNIDYTTCNLLNFGYLKEN